MNRSQLLEAIQTSPNLRGEFALWLVVIHDAVATLKAGPMTPGYSRAKGFMMDHGGVFDVFCESIDCDPEELRKLISGRS